MVRNPPKGKLEPVLQRERNCNYYDRSSIAEKQKLQLLRPLQYCKQQKKCNHYDRSIIAKRGELQLPRPFQCRERERETVIIATLSNIAAREKPELLGPLQYCRDRNCNDCDPSSMAEREIAINYYDRSSIAERYVYGDPTIISLYSQWYDPMDRRRT